MKSYYFFLRLRTDRKFTSGIYWEFKKIFQHRKKYCELSGTSGRYNDKAGYQYYWSNWRVMGQGTSHHERISGWWSLYKEYENRGWMAENGRYRLFRWRFRFLYYGQIKGTHQSQRIPGNSLFCQEKNFSIFILMSYN